MKERRHKFACFYAESGNATESAKRAGYSEKSAYSCGQRLLSYADVREEINRLQDEARKHRIANVIERQAFWSDTMRDTDCEMKDRLKASELLGKVQGDFRDRIELTGNVPVTVYVPTNGRD